MIIISIYENYVSALEKIESVLCNKEVLPFIEHVFIFGSLSRMKIHEGSDIDVLIIGNAEKTISLLNLLSSSIDKVIDYMLEVDIKYYEINKFREIKNTNLFLKHIEKDCKKIGELRNELLRFCN